MDDPSTVQKEPGVESSTKDPIYLDHLVLEEDMGDSNDEVFDPDLDTVLFITDGLIKDEQSKDHFVTQSLLSKDETVKKSLQ